MILQALSFRKQCVVAFDLCFGLNKSLGPKSSENHLTAKVWSVPKLRAYVYICTSIIHLSLSWQGALSGDQKLVWGCPAS